MGSDDYSSEDGKRKRGEDEMFLFQKSKKTQRTPGKDKTKYEENKIDMITELVKEVLKEVKDIKQKQNDLQEEIKGIRQENEKLKEENRQIKNEMLEMKDTIERLEKERIRNNIVITGLKINTNIQEDMRNGIENFIQQKVGVDIKVKKAYRIGEKTCKVELEKEEEKRQVMKNKNKLKNCQERIYINNELTKGEIEIQKEIKQIAEQERNKGKNTKIGFQKLKVEDQVWIWDKRERKMKHIPKN